MTKYNQIGRTSTTIGVGHEYVQRAFVPSVLVPWFVVDGKLVLHVCLLLSEVHNEAAFHPKLIGYGSLRSHSL